jgi:hypothetical protein
MINVNFQNIMSARATTYAATEHRAGFDTVTIEDEQFMNTVNLFLPIGTGAAVAAAINAAVNGGSE